MIRLNVAKPPKTFGPLYLPAQGVGNAVDFVLTHNLNTVFTKVTAYARITPANTVIFKVMDYFDIGGQCGMLLLDSTLNTITARIAWLFSSNTDLYFHLELPLNNQTP